MGYTYNWTQEDVKTEVYANLSKKRGKLGGKDLKATRAPIRRPFTSRSTFMSHHGAIFQVPEGTKSFDINLYSLADFYDSKNFSYNKSQIEYRTSIQITAPVFATERTTVGVLKNGTYNLPLTAEFPTLGKRLKWKVLKAPSWLDVSPSEGAGSNTLDIQRERSGAAGRDWLRRTADRARICGSVGRIRAAPNQGRSVEPVPSVGSAAGRRSPMGKSLSAAHGRGLGPRHWQDHRHHERHDLATPVPDCDPRCKTGTSWWREERR